MGESLTHAEFLATLEERFGKDPRDWAFKCPSCGDIATGRDFQEALQKFPRTHKGEPLTASAILGQECIGRTIGALVKGTKWKGRGCDWCAFGLFRGPLQITMPDGHVAYSFPIAPKETVDA